MRYLGIGDYCDLSELYLRLVAEGHEVKVFIGNPLCKNIMNGFIEKTDDWKAELSWIRAARQQGVILFENVAQGALQDRLRAGGFHVIGGSAFGDRLENDRAFGQNILRAAGLPIAGVWEFENCSAASDFIFENPGRYVLKFNAIDTSYNNFVGRFADGRDVRSMLKKLSHVAETGSGLVLMDYLEGVEMGVGAYFDGHKFLTPACLDWEHKRFFPDDLGELTGEMGTIVTFSHSRSFFERTLGKTEELFRKHGHCGYVNLNTIVNEHGVWPLEFTCRFGYPGFAILTPLQAIPWSDLLAAMAHGSAVSLPTRPGFSAGIVMTTPPFPYCREQINTPVGLPVTFDPELTEIEKSHVHYCELALENDELVTAGAYGWTMVVTGVGQSIAAASRKANALAARAVIPNVRYRTDIGKKLISGQYDYLRKLGTFGRDHSGAIPAEMSEEAPWMV